MNRRIVSWLAALGVLLAAAMAWARVGGGDSYSGSSGGSSDYGGNGGGGDGEVVYLVIRLLVWLCLEHPAVGLPLTAVVVVSALVYRLRQGGGGRVSNRRGNTPQRAQKQRTQKQRPASVGALRQRDPNFSSPLFMDFCRLLFVRAHEARGARKLDPLRPYFTESVLQELRAGSGTEVRDVVVGAARIAAVKVTGAEDHIDVHFEANLTEGANRYFVQQRWWLRRKAGVLSKGPGAITSLQCPSCGNPVALTPQGQCTACQELVTRGDFDWQVQAIETTAKHPPTQVAVKSSGGGREHGLDFSTVYQPSFAVARKELAMRYPQFSWPAFADRVREAFIALNDAWSNKAWHKARPYTTDPLFDRYRFWMERYTRTSLTNRVENVEIQKIEPCKIERDAFFDLITVRVFARMLDYTVRDSDGTVVSGSKREPREFSEYWTFLRRAGFTASVEHGAGECPSCAAPLQINQTGECEYCGALVTSGLFDWVLTAIDQDEDYAG